MEKSSKIVVFGGNGLLGGAVKRVLKKMDYDNVKCPSSSEVNLLKRKDVENYLDIEKPEYIFMLAGLVGGIAKNKARPADFLYVNSMMILNLLEGIKKYSPKSKILYVGSTCIYPRENPQPINESRFLCGVPEETNKGYAIAKGLGVVACQLYRKQYEIDAISAMPTNLYGIGDNYDLEGGHMVANMIRKFLSAKERGEKVVLWGTGIARREALYNEDCADALIYLMNNYSSEDIVNIGTGIDYSISEFADIINGMIGEKVEKEWDRSKPDGMLEKRTDISKLMKIYPEFNPRGLEDGIRNILSNEEEVERILAL
jgi:GDP-L-fucose synthase